MEKINKEVNESHRQLFANISKIYSDLSKNMTQSYLTGKKEAYEEVLNWLINSTHNENKYIPPISFYNMITEKNVKTKIALASKTEDDDTDIKHGHIKARGDGSHNAAGRNEDRKDRTVLIEPFQHNIPPFPVKMLFFSYTPAAYRAVLVLRYNNGILHYNTPF